MNMKISNWVELEDIIKSGRGFIYNDFGTVNNWNQEEFNKLHRASCIHLKRMTPGSAEWTYRFDTLKEAEEWLESNRKSDGYSYCKTCL